MNVKHRINIPYLLKPKLGAEDGCWSGGDPAKRLRRVAESLIVRRRESPLPPGDSVAKREDTEECLDRAVSLIG